MKIISHRGLLNGPDKDKENTIEAINECITHGMYAEIDIRYDNLINVWGLGHDRIETEINDIQSFFKNYGKYCILHAKTITTFAELINNYLSYDLEFFAHDIDMCALTYNRFIWHYPGILPLSKTSIAVLPELGSISYQEHIKLLAKSELIAGICTKYPLIWKNTIERNNNV